MTNLVPALVRVRLAHFLYLYREERPSQPNLRLTGVSWKTDWRKFNPVAVPSKACRRCLPAPMRRGAEEPECDEPTGGAGLAH